VYKGRKYRTQALHIYGCDEYIEKPIAPAQLLEIVGGFLTPGVSNILMGGAEPLPVTPETGDRPTDSESVEGTARSTPAVSKDDREDEIMARLDALLSGSGGASTRSAASGTSAVAAAAEEDPFALMRAELDAELGSNSTPLAYETTPKLEPIVEPLVSDQVEAPSVLEALSVPQPSAAPVDTSKEIEQPGQLVNFETKRRKKSKKTERQGTKRSQQLDAAEEIEAVPALDPVPAPAPVPVRAPAAVSREVVAPAAAVVSAALNPPGLSPGLTLPRGTMVESELEPTAARRGMPVWAWVVVAVVVAVGLYFVFPHGSSKPASPAPSPAAPPKPVASAPAVATQPPVVATPNAAVPVVATPSAATPSVATSRVTEPSRVKPESQKPVLVTAKVPAPKKRTDPVLAPAVASTTNPEPAKPEPVAIKTPAPPTPDTAVAGVETVPNSAAPAAVTTITPGALIPIDLADTMPVSIKHRAPVYSAAARQLRLFGTVTMNVLVNDRGTVDQVVLVSGVPGADLNDAAMAAAKWWTYRPATKNGVPVKVWRSEQVVFTP
jgi:TonB family protein